MGTNSVTYLKNIICIGNSYFFSIPKQFINNQLINPEYIFKITLEQTKTKAPPRKWLKPLSQQIIKENIEEETKNPETILKKEGEINNALQDFATTLQDNREVPKNDNPEETLNEEQNSPHIA